ncbi:MAG: hypothetical protein ACPW60_01300 [Methylohalobius sp. ZOD2]
MWNRRNKLNFWTISRLGIGVFAALGAYCAEAQHNPGFISATAIFQAESPNGNPISKKQARRSKNRLRKGEWIKVGGFTDSKYFYGQVQILDKRKVAGYLYPPKRGKIYVYGEITPSGAYRMFDNKGVLYRMLRVEEDY